MRNVLTSLMITVALGTGAHALWACGLVNGQHMTPEQFREYRLAKMDDPALTPQEMFGNNPSNGSSTTSSSSSSSSSSSATAPAPLPSYVVQGQSQTQVTNVTKTDPTADLLMVPQIDLVPDIAGDMLPDGKTAPQVM